MSNCVYISELKEKELLFNNEMQDIVVSDKKVGSKMLFSDIFCLELDNVKCLFDVKENKQKAGTYNFTCSLDNENVEEYRSFEQRIHKYLVENSEKIFGKGKKKKELDIDLNWSSHIQMPKDEKYQPLFNLSFNNATKVYIMEDEQMKQIQPSKLLNKRGFVCNLKVPIQYIFLGNKYSIPMIINYMEIYPDTVSFEEDSSSGNLFN
jgi:hypothetical protein